MSQRRSMPSPIGEIPDLVTILASQATPDRFKLGGRSTVQYIPALRVLSPLYRGIPSSSFLPGLLFIITLSLPLPLPSPHPPLPSPHYPILKVLVSKDLSSLRIAGTKGKKVD